MFMKLISVKLVILLVVAIISGCSEKRVHNVKNNDNKSLIKSNSHYSPDLIPVVAALHDQLNTWRTAPYQWGGTDIDGVDCSGFVWRTLKDRFNLPMKRVTTHDLIHMGVKVDKKNLRAGDLVFFKIKNGFHVGFYDTNNKFIHASVSKGVTRSSLRNVYWKRMYIGARRLPNNISEVITMNNKLPKYAHDNSL